MWPSGWSLDLHHGYVSSSPTAPLHFNPRVVLNENGASALRVLREELARSSAFLFSVAFVSPGAVALLKQELVDFRGTGTIVTSDYLGFNSPAAFAELLNLKRHGIEARIHPAAGFHPKGYVFQRPDAITAMVGSSNLTKAALATNYEWNLRVSATPQSDLGTQFAALAQRQADESVSLTQEWIDSYSIGYTAPRARAVTRPALPESPEAAPEVFDPLATVAPADLGAPAAAPTLVRTPPVPEILPNRMQHDALERIAGVRAEGATRAVVISATGTGKTILSALDVRAFQADRVLFVVHREQILDKTIEEYRRVLGGPREDFGKLSGASKDTDSRYLFATVQTLSQPHVLESFDPRAFDYIVVDEAHRAGSVTHRRVIDYFSPVFMLGMTATPERMDGFNVFELFHYNVPYEIRLSHALEEDMLSPFHYYGIADVTYEDGRTTDEFTDVARLASAERVMHLVEALDTYGQAGIAPRGLIFCSRTTEAHALSAALNEVTFRGQRLRTQALTGSDSIAERERAVTLLEQGGLDYILTVDVFNEGVDIPTVNQVIMLRQTKSAIVFVQQLGRGLRKAENKDYLVVIDFIGNYTNNYLIPIALFGDESLNKESLRKNLIAAEESGVLPGLSSVRFDEVSQQRVLASIGDTKLTTTSRLKTALTAMQNRVGGVPSLWDFYRFESVDPVLLATHKEHYPALVQSLLGVAHGLSPAEHRALGLISHEGMTARRLHEFVILRTLLQEGGASLDRLADLCRAEGISDDRRVIVSAIDTFTLEHHAEVDRKRYARGIVEWIDAQHVQLSEDVLESYTAPGRFAESINDIIATGMAIVRDRYTLDRPFTPGMQYGRKDAARALNMPRKWTPTIYGYKADLSQKVCPIFVTLHKSDEVSASTAYEDAIIDRSTMVWYTKSNRSLDSTTERAIARNELDLHVFVKKDDAEGKDFYYLGQPTAHDAVETTMSDGKGKEIPVVRMQLKFAEPIDAALFDYFHPTVTV